MVTLVNQDSYLDQIKDPVLSASVYFGQEATGLEGKKLCDMIKQSCSSSQEVPLPYTMEDSIWDYVNRPITKEVFDVLLRYYENNQRCYLDTGDKQKLKELEYWFIQVVEPKPLDESPYHWLERENTKLKGHSWYADKKTHKIVRIPTYIMNQIVENNKQVNLMVRS